MLRFVADENFDNRILSGIRRESPEIDVIRVQDIGLSGCSDPEVLEWCASANRILLTHDVETIPSFFAQRATSGKRCAGVFLVPTGCNRRTAIDDIVLAAATTTMEEWAYRYEFFPL